MCLEIKGIQSAKDAHAFMKRMVEKVPFKIQAALTDNNGLFADRFTRAGEHKPGGRRPFDHVCQAQGIEHLLIKPGWP